MELKLQKRTALLKSLLGQIRREGNIPAIVYKKNQESIPVVVDGPVFQAILRQIPKGCLATQKFSVDIDGKKGTCIVKEIAYHRTTYAIEHIDFMLVESGEYVTVNVPVIAKGEDVCPGITQGGQLKYVRRTVKLTLKASDMPEAFFLNVGNLNLGDSIRVRDIPIKEDMKMRVRPDQILIAVSK